MKNLITVAEYPPSQIPERYIRIRDLEKACIICQHWTSRRDLRKDKRYIVELEHGRCSLQKDCRSCTNLIRKLFNRRVYAYLGVLKVGINSLHIAKNLRDVRGVFGYIL